MPMTLYNTLSKAHEPFVPADPSRVTFYSCGPTVYDDAHIGNFRSFLAADVLRRFIESPLCRVQSPAGERPGPRSVVHVMNITDVGHMTDDADADGGGEDKMEAAAKRVAQAKKAGTLPMGLDIDPSDPYQIARFYEERFLADARALGLKVALEAQQDRTLMPRATQSIDGMIAVIQRLVDRGFAYVVGPPGSRVVYYRVRSFGAYGKLSGNTLDRLKEGEGGRVSVENQAGKEHPGDFLLWKEDPRHIMKWPSPWGQGYPGWHIECTAMSAARLGGPEGVGRTTLLQPGQSLIDLHSGGEDNIFPHHECEIAQSCGAFCAVPTQGLFARHWFHPRFLLVEGQKMSKSKGNFFTVRDLRARGHELAAIRLELIKTHYRSNANFTEQGLKDAARTVARWRRVLELVPGAQQTAPQGASAGDEGHSRAGEAFLERFAQAMHDDLNVASAIAEINSFVSSLDRPRPQDVRALQSADAVLGLLGLERDAASSTEIAVYLPGTSPSADVERLLVARRGARSAKNFAEADRIRAELAGMGYAIKDVAGGKVEVGRGEAISGEA